MCYLNKFYIRILSVLLCCTLPALAQGNIAPPDMRQKASDKIWVENIRPGAFQDKEINDDPNDSVIEINAPYRAEDAAVVPVSIHAKISQTQDRYIKKLHIYMDKNPLPLVGIFEFTPKNGKADLAMRVRVNDFTYFRVVAEMNNGDLFMSKKFIRSLGGCSEPLGKSTEESLARLGKMKMHTVGAVELGKPNLMQIKISHPNITGLAADQRTGVRPPAYFIKSLAVSYGGDIVMTAQITFSISQDPSFRFFFVPQKEGEMIVEATDTKNNAFKSTHKVVF